MHKKMWFAIANSLIWIAFVVGGYVQSAESIDPDPSMLAGLSVQPMDSVCKSILSDVRAGKANPSMTPGQMSKCAGMYPLSSTYYEELTGCNYVSKLDFLSEPNEFHCSVTIKQKYGYNGYEIVAIFVNGNRVGTGRVYVEDCPPPPSCSPSLPSCHPSDCKRPSYIKVIIPSSDLHLILRKPQARGILVWWDPLSGPAPKITYKTIPTWGNVINFPFWVDPSCGPCGPCLQTEMGTQMPEKQMPIYPCY